MKTLNISFKPQGALAQYLSDMRNYGKCELMYKPCKDLRQKLPELAEAIDVKTHQSVDKIVTQINSKLGGQLRDLFPGDYELLKAFDR